MCIHTNSINCIKNYFFLKKAILFIIKIFNFKYFINIFLYINNLKLNRIDNNKYV